MSTVPTTGTLAPRATIVAATVCPSCAGTGWADPWEIGEGTPELTSCDRCLGVGLDGCADCDGEGSLAVPVVCPCQEAAAA